MRVRVITGEFSGVIFDIRQPLHFVRLKILIRWTVVITFSFFGFIVIDGIRQICLELFAVVLGDRVRFIPIVEQLILIEIVEIIAGRFLRREDIFFRRLFALDATVLIVFKDETL